jgi:hypothetical protein
MNISNLPRKQNKKANKKNYIHMIYFQRNLVKHQIFVILGILPNFYSSVRDRMKWQNEPNERWSTQKKRNFPKNKYRRDPEHYMDDYANIE